MQFYATHWSARAARPAAGALPVADRLGASAFNLNLKFKLKLQLELLLKFKFTGRGRLAAIMIESKDFKFKLN